MQKTSKQDPKKLLSRKLIANRIKINEFETISLYETHKRSHLLNVS
jgi:hypothetical protein